MNACRSAERRVLGNVGYLPWPETNTVAATASTTSPAEKADSNQTFDGTISSQTSVLIVRQIANPVGGPISASNGFRPNGSSDPGVNTRESPETRVEQRFNHSRI